jgi:GNAT superfamily N-acetyltransferase
VGIAIYSLLWLAPGITSSLYLKELFVSGSRQRDDVGRSLMQAVIEQAHELGCSRTQGRPAAAQITKE